MAATDVSAVSLLPYYGGKQRLAETIFELLPDAAKTAGYIRDALAA